jgi:hypothetical protein
LPEAPANKGEPDTKEAGGLAIAWEVSCSGIGIAEEPLCGAESLSLQNNSAQSSAESENDRKSASSFGWSYDYMFLLTKRRECRKSFSKSTPDFFRSNEWIPATNQVA